MPDIMLPKGQTEADLIAAFEAQGLTLTISKDWRKNRTYVITTPEGESLTIYDQAGMNDWLAKNNMTLAKDATGKLALLDVVGGEFAAEGPTPAALADGGAPAGPADPTIRTVEGRRVQYIPPQAAVPATYHTGQMITPGRAATPGGWDDLGAAPSAAQPDVDAQIAAALAQGDTQGAQKLFDFQNQMSQAQRAQASMGARDQALRIGQSPGDWWTYYSRLYGDQPSEDFQLGGRAIPGYAGGLLGGQGSPSLGDQGGPPLSSLGARQLLGRTALLPPTPGSQGGQQPVTQALPPPPPSSNASQQPPQQASGWNLGITPAIERLGQPTEEQAPAQGQARGWNLGITPAIERLAAQPVGPLQGPDLPAFTQETAAQPTAASAEEAMRRTAALGDTAVAPAGTQGGAGDRQLQTARRAIRGGNAPALGDTRRGLQWPSQGLADVAAGGQVSGQRLLPTLGAPRFLSPQTEGGLTQSELDIYDAEVQNQGFSLRDYNRQKNSQFGGFAGGTAGLGGPVGGGLRGVAGRRLGR